jgi:hypothetical protein
MATGTTRKVVGRGRYVAKYATAATALSHHLINAAGSENSFSVAQWDTGQKFINLLCCSQNEFALCCFAYQQVTRWALPMRARQRSAATTNRHADGHAQMPLETLAMGPTPTCPLMSPSEDFDSEIFFFSTLEEHKPRIQPTRTQGIQLPTENMEYSTPRILHPAYTPPTFTPPFASRTRMAE